MPLKDAIAWLLDPKSEDVQYPKDFVKQCFERFMTSNALELKKATKKTRPQMAAHFKLRMASDSVTDGKVPDKVETGKNG